MTRARSASSASCSMSSSVMGVPDRVCPYTRACSSLQQPPVDRAQRHGVNDHRGAFVGQQHDDLEQSAERSGHRRSAGERDPRPCCLEQGGDAPVGRVGPHGGVVRGPNRPRLRRAHRCHRDDLRLRRSVSHPGSLRHRRPTSPGVHDHRGAPVDRQGRAHRAHRPLRTAHACCGLRVRR